MSKQSKVISLTYFWSGSELPFIRQTISIFPVLQNLASFGALQDHNHSTCFSGSPLSPVATLLKPGLSPPPASCWSHLMARTWISPCRPQQTRESAPAPLNSSLPPHTLNMSPPSSDPADTPRPSNAAPTRPCIVLSNPGVS